MMNNKIIVSKTRSVKDVRTTPIMFKTNPAFAAFNPFGVI